MHDPLRLPRALSMLATLADRGEQRPWWLVLGNRHEDQGTGVRQLAKLPAGWTCVLWALLQG